MMFTASRIPVPDPIAPSMSAVMVSNPTHIPPRAAATGMYQLKKLTIDSSPKFITQRSLLTIYLTMSLVDIPETSNQSLARIAHEAITNTV